MMLGLADIEGGRHQEPRLVARPPRNDLRTKRIGAKQPVRAVLLGRTDGDQDGLGLDQIGLDLRPGGKMKLHAKP